MATVDPDRLSRRQRVQPLVPCLRTGVRSVAVAVGRRPPAYRRPTLPSDIWL